MVNHTTIATEPLDETQLAKTKTKQQPKSAFQYKDPSLGYKKPEYTKNTKNTSRTVLLLKKGGTFEWTHRKASENTRTAQCFDAKRLKKWIHFLINNLYVEVGGALFRQIVGIPMGTNSAPMILSQSASLMSSVLSFVHECWCWCS